MSVTILMTIMLSSLRKHLKRELLVRRSEIGRALGTSNEILPYMTFVLIIRRDIASTDPDTFHDVPSDEDGPSPAKKQNSPSKQVAKELSRLSLRKSSVTHIEEMPEVVDLIEEF